MHRIDHATREIDLHGPGKDGFTEGSPGVTPPTVVTADIANALQEEICNVVEGAGLTLSKPDNTQLVTAIEAYKYRTPPSRTVVIPVCDWQVGRGSGSLSTWDFVHPEDYVIANKADVTTRGIVAVRLNRILPHGAVITLVEVLVDPGAPSRGTPMETGLTAHVNRNYTTGLESVGTQIDVITEPDDGTDTLQGITLTPSVNNTIDAEVPYLLWVRTGAGDTAPDRLYGAAVTFTDPGPRNR